jgi:hypothetical protein
MFTNSAHPSGQAIAKQDYLTELRAARRAERACCCTAKPMIVALIPPAPGRPHVTDLLLCGHHYRLSRRALAAAAAVVTEIGAAESGDQASPMVHSAG